ncbi:patatin-like phospholipase family protein [Ancylomarina longa]|uniref:Patatin family protein n=1 Tax=Ancylomarina longa TaxID=2487017 RepID=A0A434ATA3_9BACT|nr:patatin family protein [Ancylomarina longa]RUT77653.1 patatin family protein [Ancylomarina longa]
MNCRAVKTALVVEGGAMRGIFAAGVLDRFLEDGFQPFDFVVGVSAGAINAAAFLAGQKGRNLEVFTKYSLYPEYINWRKFVTGGHLLDLDWLWDITTKKLPINTNILFANSVDFEIGVSLNINGSSRFIRPNAENLSHVMKASCTVPLFYRNYLKIDGQTVSDGGVSAPIPINRAVEKGALKIMVIRSRSKDYRMKQGMENKLSRFLFRNHPGLSKAIQNRPEVYNSSIDFIQNPPKNIKIVDVCPPNTFRTKRFTKDFQTLMDDYHLGVESGDKAIFEWNSI